LKSPPLLESIKSPALLESIDTENFILVNTGPPLVDRGVFSLGGGAAAAKIGVWLNGKHSMFSLKSRANDVQKYKKAKRFLFLFFLLTGDL